MRRKSIPEEELVIETETAPLRAILALPRGCRSIVLFAHGAGSSRHSPRNQYVAGELNKAGFATMLMDLLTVDEERIDMNTGRLRFDVPLLAGLLVVGAKDRIVLQMNKDAAKYLTTRYELAVVPGASHLFEEPGALATVA